MDTVRCDLLLLVILPVGAPSLPCGRLTVVVCRSSRSMLSALVTGRYGWAVIAGISCVWVLFPTRLPARRFRWGLARCAVIFWERGLADITVEGSQSVPGTIFYR